MGKTFKDRKDIQGVKPLRAQAWGTPAGDPSLEFINYEDNQRTSRKASRKARQIGFHS